MISKKFAMKSESKSNFGRLVNYLSDSQDKNERVGEISITNCNSIDIESAILEVLATQQINQRATGDKTYHLMISFAPDEKVSEKVLKEIEQRFCDALGFTDHQRVSVVHNDTDSLHIHLAINKIHPTKHTMHEPYNDYKVRSALCEKIENEYNLVKVNHNSRKNESENKADDFEQHTGIGSLLNWTKENCMTKLYGADTWADFHLVLAEHGLIIKPRANGLVITNQDGHMIKASSVARDFSKDNLEKMFGSFVPMDEKLRAKVKVKMKYVEKPISKKFDTTELYAAYKRHQDKAVTSRNEALLIAKDNKAKQIKSAKLSAKAKRNSLKLMKMSRDSKKRLYGLIGTSLLKKINKINTKYRSQTTLIYSSCKQQSWADWLRTQAMAGNVEAVNALRGRSGKDNLIYNTITGGNTNAYVSPKRDSITKEGVVIYSNKRFAIRDDGKSIKVSRDTSHDGVIAALKVAVAKYGEVIKVDGDNAFKEQALLAAGTSNIKIKFSDDDLNKRLIELRKRFKHESSGRGYRGGISKTATGPNRGNRNNGQSTVPEQHVIKNKQRANAAGTHTMRTLSERVMVFEKRGSNVPLQTAPRNNVVDGKQGSHNPMRR